MKLLFFLFGLFISTIGYTQTSSVSYECQLNLKINNPEEGLNKLYFSGNQSLYVFKDWPKENSSENKGNIVSFTPGDTEGMPVYTNLETQTQVYKTSYFAPSNAPWILTEPIPKIEWKVTREKKEFESLTAYFATGVYGGRTYEVWFTPDIPVPLGPHRLNGLPGMILEAKSTDGKVSFTFSGYTSIETDSVIIAPPTLGTNISRELLERYLIQHLLKTEADSPPEWNDTDNDPPADYEIEKNKWTIFGDFKRKRKLKKGGW